MKNSIKVERARMNITQEELAKKAGVTRQAINAIETNKYAPSIVLAFKIAKALKVKITDIFEPEPRD